MPWVLSLRPVRRWALAGAATAAALVAAGCDASDNPDLVAGKQLFVERCGSCHILDRAETKGTTGPDLDEAFQRILKDGTDREAVEGVVHGQILHPREGSIMPAKLVEGDEAHDVAAYVAESVARPGKDEGVLADAVKTAASDEPAVAENGTLTIPTDPGGQLLYVNSTAQAPAGEIEIVMPNESSTPHDIVIDGKGRTPVVTNDTASFTATYEPGEYQYYCSVPGHRQAGMEGTLTVAEGG